MAAILGVSRAQLQELVYRESFFKAKNKQKTELFLRRNNEMAHLPRKVKQKYVKMCQKRVHHNHFCLINEVKEQILVGKSKLERETIHK